MLIFMNYDIINKNMSIRYLGYWLKLRVGKEVRIFFNEESDEEVGLSRYCCDDGSCSSYRCNCDIGLVIEESLQIVCLSQNKELFPIAGRAL